MKKLIERLWNIVPTERKIDMACDRDLKCQCCRCWDSCEGCQAFDCDVDFKISIEKVKNVSRESGMSVEAIVGLIQAEDDRRNAMHIDACRAGHDAADNDNFLPDNFDPYRDTKFLITFADYPDLGKKLLVDLDTENLKRLKAEIDTVLKMRDA